MNRPSKITAASHTAFCLRGHLRTPENVVQRECRTCRIERQRLRRAENPDKPRSAKPRPAKAPRTPGPPSSIADRFWAKVQKTGTCWLWTAATNHKGYGRIVADGGGRPATHVSWLLRHGQYPPAGLLVCHTCDNPPCVNPDHLWLGTHADNKADCVRKGRHYKPAKEAASA